MSLFQKSVEKKSLNQLDSVLIDRKYKQFQDYFGNAEIQENIRNAKEEQFQEGFLRELFVSIFDYTLNPQPNFNLTTELKNIANSKKADGAILKGEDAIAVIELKGTDTTDIDKIETQAFGYKNHHPKCVYVVTSNFEKLRFYIQNAVDHIDFDLFNLTREQFSLMWLCLAKENLLNGLALKIKESSVLQEENITKKLYADYSKFREAIYNNLVKNNPDTDKLLLFKKTQKLLDRFLFVFFAEDRLLLPPNSISEIVKQWTTLKDELDEYVPLYDRFKKYFGYMNTGYKGKKYDIYAYNGGLFSPDEVLDNIAIDDHILHEHTLKLSTYDFETDVDVNILGHIFEHSLGEIENVQAEIASENKELLTDHAAIKSENKGLQPLVPSALQPLVPSTLQPLVPSTHQPSVQSKRKKDGIFYTPKYITKYIVENTVGRLCEEKRTELDIVDEEYANGRRNRRKETIKTLDDKLNDYRNWLLSITILDPACGSGAFLNQTLDFLIKEHQKIDDLRAQLFGSGLVFSDITPDILEKNIYGVDLNEESVEIAKLSLWLRTAQKGRKLNKLNNNIKCGNSLIDDPEVAGDKAFNWQKEFPAIFKEKEKKAWHVTWVTHDTRTSERMITYKVRERRADGEMHIDRSVYLEGKDEIKVSEIISDIVVENNLNCLAYNICSDHVHILLVCQEDELPNIVRKLKGKSAQKFKEFQKIPKDETFNLWAQKFDKKVIESDKQLANTIEYIKGNREKHQLPDINTELKSLDANPVDEHLSNNKGLQPLVENPDSDDPLSTTPDLDEHLFNKGLQPLVDKMTCTHEHAFRPEYTGGFDVVIGNPPYVQLQSMGEMSDLLKNSGYETFDKGADLYCLFTERGYTLLRNGGMLSFIMPNKWMLVSYGKPLRKFLSKTGLRQILNFGDVQFFQEATTYVCIFVTQKGETKDNTEVLSLNQKTYHGDFLTEVKANLYDFPTSNFGENEWSIQPHNDSRKLEQMKLKGTELKDLPIGINYGIKTGHNDAFFINEETRKKLIAADAKSAELIKPMVRGRDISAYGISDREFLINVHNGIKEKNPPLPPIIIDHYSAIKGHLDAFYPQLEKRGDKGDTPYNLRNCAYLEEFAQPKIIYPNMTSVFPFVYDESGLLSNDKSFILSALDDSVSLLFLTAIFNSSLAKLWIWYNCPELQGGTREIRKVYFEHFPVPQANNEQTDTLALNATARAQLTADLQALASKFTNTIQRKFHLEKLSGKLQNWYQLSYAAFIKELSKNKVKLSLSDEAEWEVYFKQEQKKALEFRAKIEATDQEIDRMVYALYGLTEAEIKNV